MKKSDTLNLWRDLPDRLDPLPKMEVIPYKAEGSRYGACGVRIDGTPEFIDAVLSNLKTLLDGENHLTRLELARSKVDGSKLGKAFHHAGVNSEVCYIRLHQRGGEGARASMIFDKDLHAPTGRFLDGRKVRPHGVTCRRKAG